MANLHRVRMTKMRADALAIHPTAQRDKSQPYIKRLMDKFDLDAVGTIHAVQYPISGKMSVWVIDGQHRLAALIELGLGEWEVDVAIHVDVKSDARASELFLKLTSRLHVGPFDSFVNELRSGDPVAVGISDIAQKFGLHIGKQSGDGYLACPSSLKKAFRRDDGAALSRSLEWLNHSYGKKASALEGKLIEGVSLVAANNNGNIEDAAMVKKLAKYSGGASALMGDAKGRMQFNKGSLARSIANLVIDTYNIGRRAGRLDPL